MPDKALAIALICVSEAKGEFDVLLGEVLVGRLHAATATLITRGNSCSEDEKRRLMNTVRLLVPRVRTM